MLSGRTNAFHQSELTRIRAAAPALGLVVRSVDARTAGEFAEIIRSWAKAGVEAFYVQPSSAFTDVHRARIADLALQARLPAMGALDYFAEAGCLASYGANRIAWHHRSAYYVDRILKGAETGRPACRAADPVRAGDQHEDRKGARPHGSARHAPAGRPADRVDAAYQSSFGSGRPA